LGHACSILRDGLHRIQPSMGRACKGMNNKQGTRFDSGNTMSYF
jgi:hypothetical protein